MPLKRTVRGIRDSIPPGYVVGRIGSEEGPAQLISMKELTLSQQAAMPSGQLSIRTGVAADFGFFFQGKPAFSNMVLNTVKFTKGVSLPANLLGSQFVADTPPVADYTVTLFHNAGSVGTIKFAAGTGAVTVTFVAAVSFSIGDTLTVKGPVAADAVIQDISFGFAGTFL